MPRKPGKIDRTKKKGGRKIEIYSMGGTKRDGPVSYGMGGHEVGRKQTK